MAENEMVERVARAICHADNVNPEHQCRALGKRVPRGETWPAWKVRVPQAVAAIAAMREPTEGMIDAGDATDVSWSRCDPTPMSAKEVWIAMIDEVLK